MIYLAGKWDTSRRAMPWLLFWLGCALTLVGFVSNGMWTNMGWVQTALLAELGLAAAFAGWLLNRLTGFALATSSGAIWLLALIYFAGFTSFGAVILLALVSMALGSLFVPAEWTERSALSMLGGLALISGVVGWLLPFPVHGHIAYLAVALAVVAVRWRHLADMFHPTVQGWRSAVAAEPVGMWLAVMAVGLVTTCAWLPTTHYDDLAYHLGLQSQLVSLGYYKMDAASNLWALSAWSADVLQAVAWILAGHESRGILDTFWLLLGLVFILRLSEALDLPPWRCCLAVALYASLPMTANTLKSMQTEGPTAALTAGIALMVLRSPRPDRRRLLVLALLFGLLLGLKISNLMIAGPLGLWLLCRWRFRLPWRTLPIALLLFLLVAGSSYAYAWILAGNPVLPVFNAIFHSPYYTPTNFHDGHWNAGFRWNIVWNLVFHTSGYVEGGDGTAGFILIMLGGSLLVALFNRRARPLALVALGSFLLPLTQIQYLRYAHQALPLLIPAMLCGIPAIAPNSRRSRLVGAALIVLVTTNMALVSTSGWQLKHGELRQFLTEPRQDFLTRYAPMKRVMDVVDQRYGASARVLITSHAIPYAGGFGGIAYVVSWYDQALAARAAQADRDATGQSWVRLVDDTGVNLLVLQSGHVSEALAAALALVHGHLVTQVGDIQLWQAQRAVAGIPQVGPPGKARLKFDTSSMPEGSTLVDAHVTLDCRPFGAPVAMSWTITERGVHPWTHSNWVNCLPDGTARANLSVAVPRSIVGFEVSAQSATQTTVQLNSASSELEVRKDFGKHRDLARGMRERLLAHLAWWIDPWTAASVMHAGVLVLPSPSHGVVVRYELPKSAAGGVVRATLALECRYSPVPIVVGWRMAEHGVAPVSQYAWTRCGIDGVARAKFHVRTRYRVVALTATALPADGGDMRLGLRDAESGFVATSGFRGVFSRQRIKLAKWLIPIQEVSRVAQ
jgi:hypothetical protein